MPKKVKEMDMKRPPKKPSWFWKIIMMFLTFFFSGPFATRTKISAIAIPRPVCYTGFDMIFTKRGRFL